MKTDLQIFIENGGEKLQKQLSYMALYACYLSEQHKIPFCIHHIIDNQNYNGHNYLTGFLHGICVAQDSPIMCSRFIAITPLWQVVDWFLCAKISQELIEEAERELTEGIKNNLKAKFEIVNNSFSISVNHLFNFAGKLNMQQTSTNDDLCLYALTYAYRHQHHTIPLTLFAIPPYYSLVSAWGFTNGLQAVLGDKFKCSFDATGMINDIHVDEEYFKSYTRENLIKDYDRRGLPIEGLMDMIEQQIDSLKIKVK